MSEPVVLIEDSVPVFPRGVRFRHDEARGAWVLLGPERVIMPDEIAVEVLKLVDGKASVAVVIDDLARRFAAPREVILPDVLSLLNDLAEKGFVKA